MKENSPCFLFDCCSKNYKNQINSINFISITSIQVKNPTKQISNKYQYFTLIIEVKPSCVDFINNKYGQLRGHKLYRQLQSSNFQNSIFMLQIIMKKRISNKQSFPIPSKLNYSGRATNIKKKIDIHTQTDQMRRPHPRTYKFPSSLQMPISQSPYTKTANPEQTNHCLIQQNT